MLCKLNNWNASLGSRPLISYNKGEKNLLYCVYSVLEQARLTKRPLAILTSTAEGTMRQLAKSPNIDSEVGCQAGSCCHAVNWQKGLYASQFSQAPRVWKQQKTDKRNKKHRIIDSNKWITKKFSSNYYYLENREIIFSS